MKRASSQAALVSPSGLRRSQGAALAFLDEASEGQKAAFEGLRLKKKKSNEPTETPGEDGDHVAISLGGDSTVEPTSPEDTAHGHRSPEVTKTLEV